MKKFILLLALLIPFVSYSEETNQGQTKITKFESERGVIRKFIDVKLNNLPSPSVFNSYQAVIRTYLDDSSNTYFYIVEEREKNNVINRAVIEYSDLLEVIRAINKISTEEETDCRSNPEYLINQFFTVDGVSVGYYVKDKKSHWFIIDVNDGSFEVKNYNELLKALIEAKDKIEFLKQQYGK